MANYTVTVLTATYNRRQNLTKLYESLCRQTNKDFQWLIIDDGSSDDTKQYIESLPQNGFLIEYHKKINGGKHTALNYSHLFIKGQLVFMVDSDDFIIDTAIEKINNEWINYRTRLDIGVLSFRKQIINGKVLSAEVHEPFIDDDISYRVNNNINGDRCEVIRSDLFKKYPLPEFDGEKFMGEGWLFRNIAYNYKTVYLNEALYICEYLENGLSKNGRLLRMKCPYGMMENCKSFFVPQVCKKQQIKQTIAFWTYGFCAGISNKEIVKRSGKGNFIYIFFPMGKMLFLFWKKKYGFRGV